MKYMLFNIETNKVLAAGFKTQEEANDYALNELNADLFYVVVLPYHMLSL